MKEKWTGSLVGKMHNHEITREDLARRLGVTKAYVSMVLNCERKPKNAKEIYTEAVNEIIEERSAK